MKKIVLLFTTVLLITACGPSEKEIKLKMLNTSVANVCDCFESNKKDWLGYQKCKERIRTGRILLEDDAENLAEYEKQIQQCDQYFKD